MIPAGWIHFVFTPEDSIVIGGNFLTEQSMEMQFEIARLEEELLKTKPEIKSNTFQGFRNIMWMYLERVLIPQVRYAHEHGGLSHYLIHYRCDPDLKKRKNSEMHRTTN